VALGDPHKSEASFSSSSISASSPSPVGLQNDGFHRLHETLVEEKNGERLIMDGLGP
jgi:hypothetical protein